jgi:cytochrome c5
MQVGQFFTSYLETVRTGWANYKHKGDKKALDTFHRVVRSDGIIFALENHGKVVSGKQLNEADLKAYGAARPPYGTVILEFLADHPSHGEVPHVVFAMDCPSDEHVLIAMSFKTIHKDPENWTIPAVFWRINYDGSSFMRDEKGQWATNMKPYSCIQGAYNDIRKLRADLADDEFTAMLATQGWFALNTYLRFCVACHNYETDFADVEPDKATNKMRRARGKAPLFTYKVLTIGKKKPKSRRLGGTHASPRSHLRRGYFRTSRNGVRHWVQPCMVKGETDGFVHKDYRVEGAIECES